MNNQKPAQNNANQNQANGTASRFSRPATNAQKNTNNTLSRFSGTPNRFGSSDMSCVILPIDETFVRFDLNGLGDPFHRLLGTELNLDYANINTLIEFFEKGGDEVNALTEQMEKAWRSYQFKGASLVYPWRDDIKQIVSTSLIRQVQPANTNNNNDAPDLTNSDDTSADDDQDPPACLRSIDLLLVLNVLARTRADILLEDATISLERGFLHRSLMTNDPTLVAIGRATGCVEEHFR